MHTCLYVNTYNHTYKIHAYMASICTYMHVSCTYVLYFQILLPKRRGRDSLPAEGSTPVQQAFKTISKTMQNAFDVFRSRIPFYLVRGGENCHHASMAVKNQPNILSMYFLFITYVHTRIYIHIHAYMCIHVYIHTDRYIYIHVCSTLYL